MKPPHIQQKCECKRARNGGAQCMVHNPPFEFLKGSPTQPEWMKEMRTFIELYPTTSNGQPFMLPTEWSSRFANDVLRKFSTTIQKEIERERLSIVEECERHDCRIDKCCLTSIQEFDKRTAKKLDKDILDALKEQDWEKKFDKLFIDENIWKSDNEDTAFVGVGNIKYFIQKEIERAYARGYENGKLAELEDSVGAEINIVQSTLDKVRKEAVERENEKYQELLYAVARKFPNETRHETALRYIKEAEVAEASGLEASPTVVEEK